MVRKNEILYKKVYLLINNYNNLGSFLHAFFLKNANHKRKSFGSFFEVVRSKVRFYFLYSVVKSEVSV